MLALLQQLPQQGKSGAGAVAAAQHQQEQQKGCHQEAAVPVVAVAAAVLLHLEEGCCAATTLRCRPGGPCMQQQGTTTTMMRTSQLPLLPLLSSLSSSSSSTQKKRLRRRQLPLVTAAVAAVLAPPASPWQLSLWAPSSPLPDQARPQMIPQSSRMGRGRQGRLLKEALFPRERAQCQHPLQQNPPAPYPLRLLMMPVAAVRPTPCTLLSPRHGPAERTAVVSWMSLKLLPLSLHPLPLPQHLHLPQQPLPPAKLL